MTLTVPAIPASAAEDFPIDAVWSGATQWMSGVDSGYEAFGGSIAKGVDFFGSSVVISNYVTVEIVFESDTTLWSLAQVFRRDMSHNSFGVGQFPGSCWDISDPTNPRRLNICFEENDDGAGPIPSPNLRWDPDTSQFGKYELLFVMNSTYDSTGTTYAGINIQQDDPDVLYAWWPRLAPGHTFLETMPASLFISPRINLKAVQQGYDVNLKWLTPGPGPDYYELYLGIGHAPDSLLTFLALDDTIFVHSNVVIGQEYHYRIKSRTAESTILSSREVILTVRNPITVAAVFPVSQEIQADTLTDIVVAFDSVMNPATINSSTFKVFGHWSGPKFGTYQMENGNMQVRFTTNEPFSAGEWVLVSLAQSIEFANGASQLSGYAWSFWVKTKPASINLVQIDEISVLRPGEEPIMCYGAYGGDINDDGYTDITAVNEISDDVRVFLNDGSGIYDSFTVYPFEGGGFGSANDGADFNSDGKIDMAVGAFASNKLRVIINNGSGGFNSPNYYTTGDNNSGVAVLDLNGDGLSDIATSNNQANKIYTLLNNSDGTFASAVQIETGSEGEFSCASGDANNDGILDLFVGARNAQEVVLLLGDGNGGLDHSTTLNSGGRTHMLATGDVNLDGNIDVVCANSGSTNASVIFGDGLGGLLEPVIYPTPSGPIAIDLGDIDGDGDLEMVTSSVNEGIFRVFENDGIGNYTDPRDYPAPTAASCMTLHDRDRDGVMDLTGIDEFSDLILLFEPVHLVSCCVEARGDLNGDGSNCNVLDLNFLVNYIFRGSGNPGSCPEESDVNGDSSNPNVLDLNYVVNRIFRGGAAPPACP